MDPIINKIRGTKLEDPTCRYRLIFVPCYLNGNDGIFNKHYYELLCGMDLTVYPSYYEPWGTRRWKASPSAFRPSPLR